MQLINQSISYPSFLRGLARALDIRGAVAPHYHHHRLLGEQGSDEAAVAADWAAVWSDLGGAFSRVVERDTADAHG